MDISQFDECAKLFPRLGKGLQKNLHKMQRDQHLLAKAVCKKPILRLPNVIGAGAGIHMRRGKPSGCIGPIVCVSKKLKRSMLKPNERVPKSIEVRGKRYPIDVVELRDAEPTCRLGVPDTQRLAHDPIPPDVQFGGHDPSDGLQMNSFTGGAIVRRSNDTAPDPALFLLTAKHAIHNVITYTISQPAGGRFVGGHVASSATLDAAVAEINRPSSPFHCFGQVINTVPAIAGMKVKKSGARTGITGSQILATVFISWEGHWNNMVLMDDNLNIVPHAPYHDRGDSGSMSVLGAPDDPNDLGDPINRIVDLLVNQLSGFMNQRLARWILHSILRSSAVGLNVGEASFGRFTLAHPIDEVLTDLGLNLT